MLMVVYCLSNPSSPGVFIIRQGKSIKKALKQINTNLVPEPYECLFYIESDDIEQICAALKKYQHNSTYFYIWSYQLHHAQRYHNRMLSEIECAFGHERIPYHPKRLREKSMLPVEINNVHWVYTFANAAYPRYVHTIFDNDDKFLGIYTNSKHDNDRLELMTGRLKYIAECIHGHGIAGKYDLRSVFATNGTITMREYAKTYTLTPGLVPFIWPHVDYTHLCGARNWTKSIAGITELALSVYKN